MRLRDSEMGDSQVKSADNDGVVRLARNRFIAGLPRIRSGRSYTGVGIRDSVRTISQVEASRTFKRLKRNAGNG
jgi:hypothetical protein